AMRTTPKSLPSSSPAQPLAEATSAIAAAQNPTASQLHRYGCPFSAPSAFEKTAQHESTVVREASNCSASAVFPASFRLPSPLWAVGSGFTSSLARNPFRIRTYEKRRDGVCVKHVLVSTRHRVGVVEAMQLFPPSLVPPRNLLEAP